MEFLYEYGLFLLKAITVVAAIAAIIVMVFSAGAGRALSDSEGTITVVKVNDRFDEMHKSIKRAIHDDDTVKKEEKLAKKDKKKKIKAAKKLNHQDGENHDKRVFLVDFEGDMKASAVSELREVVSAILFTATTVDEVVVRLESPGGMVHGYGLAASQLDRLRQKKIPLTICVDKVAASGGYMMACVADKVCAAPFAIIGSIGVVAQLPNFHKLLKKHDIDYELLTAGEYKRTLTVFGENTDKARNKFVEDLEETHQIFKDYVQQQRPIVDIEQVATGEIWLGTKAKEKQLVDQLITSDDYITGLAADHDIFRVSYDLKKSLSERLGISIQLGIEKGINRLFQQLQLSRFFQ